MPHYETLAGRRIAAYKNPMTRHIPGVLSRLFVLIAFVAMASSGFAHRLSAPNLDPSLLAYVQVGGSLDDLCGESGDTSHSGSQNCDACRLVHAAVLAPVEADITRPILRSAASPCRVSAERPPSGRIDLSRAARAPPTI
ncbi:hypothetical protein [Puniceibacterium sp. IMCC21224]|uniref:hypothetical protein n=1 Tax=Puniceibacterium sp. IMCC21224 TaxID=1618204 RepID=UPI00065DA5B7|nr:hypothetical protein [Puniceibacterium sp. IMCC21224]KMK68686.1 hypothetical protein IMCC21224_113570 [Puniceibacterium sp. IMCC21224]